MSDQTLRYEYLYLYTESDQANSASFLDVLLGMGADCDVIPYKSEYVAESLIPLNTWNFDDMDGAANFSSMPLLIFRDVLWESPDKEHQYFRTCHATSADQLPSDFKDKVIKVSV
jgi:hypothetical protein|tara:strand:+ start:1853 stop:2197 length:345 start_codon:yes stop_codon:yes gene_type:complete